MAMRSPMRGENCVMHRVAFATGATLVLATTLAVHQTVVNLANIGTPDAIVTRAAKTPLLASKGSLTSATPVPPGNDGSSLTFDVVNIDPQGASVFAGQAPTNSSVSVLANGRELATATADETGAWAIVTDRKLAAGDYEFSLSARSPQHDVTAGQSVRMVIAPVAPDVASSPTPEAVSPLSIPAPITFVYNDTTFTAQGRRAADLLAKRLVEQQPAMASLSGHADERGSDLYNMELSRRRLSVVADYLRDSGFVGKLELIPKGKSEPYAAIDRNALPKEEVLQLDRRVELLHSH
jgi:outer membrane protein OmpA-like peptidoglycan-associated protein